MTYQPYLIANYATGLDTDLQPWLIPDDAQEQLFDGFVYRGVMSKRSGYNYFATGERGGAPYRESRIVHALSGVAMVGAINGINMTYTLAATAQIARGSVVITGSNPVQVATDNGVGGFTGPVSAGSIDYTTGAITVTFNAAPIAASTVTVTYSFYPGNPVMMIANFVTTSNIKQLIVADTRYVNRYNSTTNILEDISPVAAYTGGNQNFFTWVNYASGANVPRLLFSNNVDPIQMYDGATVAAYTYTLAGVATLTCSFMVEFKDRLVLLRTTENGIIFPKRIRVSGFGANSDVFDTSATGAGVIDIPDGAWIQGAAFNRDDLIIFTESSTWVLKYTGNDTVPFVLDKIDESRGSQATFSAITYLNKTSAASPRGLIISDGYKVERQDDKIPDFSFNEIDGTNFGLCFAGSVDEDRDHYLIYPRTDETASSRILVTNYDEDNYNIYRLPLSCMGTYITAFDFSWNDLLIYPNWAAFASAYGNWNSFAYASGAPFSVGGGHKGEIWRLNVTEVEDNPVRIRNMTIVDSTTIQVTTDWNNYSLNLSDPEKGADTIFITGVSGMLEINDGQYPIISVTSNNVFNIKVPNASTFTPYTSGGVAQRVIPFSATFKKFNPYVMSDRKVRCGWLYMYVSTSGTNLKRNLAISNISQDSPAVVTTLLDHGLSTSDQVGIFGVVGMTEVNGFQYFITVIDQNNFSLDGIDSTGYTPYTSGGYVAAPVNAKISIDIITNDVGHKTQLNNLSQDPYQGTVSNLQLDDGTKKWYKVYVNQTARFIQFRVRNLQAGAKVDIHATMPGFAPTGKLI